MPIDPHIALGARLPSREFTWTPSDVQLYQLGLGAGTQVFTEGFGEAIFGTGVLAGDLAKGVAWLVNLAVAEWAIRRPAGRRRPIRRRAVARGRAGSGALS